jgi:hypothetical protein
MTVMIDQTFYVPRLPYLLEFFAYETIGAAIHNVAPMGRLEYDDGTVILVPEALLLRLQAEPDKAKWPDMILASMEAAPDVEPTIPDLGSGSAEPNQ